MSQLVKALSDAPFFANAWETLPASVSNILCSR